MANLLSWNGGLNLQKKKNELGVTPLISSLRTMSVMPAKTSSVSRPLNGTTNTKPSIFPFANIAQQQQEQRRQQEEQQRQQRIAEAQRQQEQRKQQEQARKLQQQQAQQQKQRSLLTSAGLGGSPFGSTDLRANLGAQRQSRIRREQEAAAKKAADEQANPWKKYYEEEKQKVRDQAFKNDHFGSTLQDMFNAGWDRRLAEVNARNRYTQELQRKAFDDEGNTLDENALEQAKKFGAETSKVAKQYTDQEHATGKAIGATYDSDYKDNRFYGTLNAIRRMDVGNAITGGAEGGLADAGKFILNLLPGMMSAPIQGGGNIAEAISGKGTDSQTGEHKELTGLERLGRGASGAIDAAGVFFGGSGDLLNSVGNALFKKGATEVTKQALKNTTKDVVKGYIKAMIEEGAEEGVQQAFEFFGDGGRLVTADGEFDADSFKQLLAETGQAAALGAIGGGIFHGGAQAIDAAKSNINNRLVARNARANATANLNTNVNENNNLVDNTTTNVNENVNEETNIDPSRIKTTEDGTMTKTNADGTATRLSDSELANVITQNTANRTQVSGVNPFETNSLNFRSSDEDINVLNRRAEQGDSYAQQRLSELTGQNQDENVDWRGKSVDEIINPENSGIGVNDETEVSFSERDAYGEAADRAEIERYYKQYGEDFYEKMPEYLRDTYEQLLDDQPRNANGVYTDPITGDEVIDQAVSKYEPTAEELGIDVNKLAPQMFDENGNPMIMYHGTPNGGFERFNDGSYFTPDRNYAARYLEPSASSMAKSGVQKATNPMMYDTYLDIRKPFDLNDETARNIFINDYVKGGNAIGINPYLSDAEYRAIDNLDWTEVESLRDFLQENGYDYDAIIANEGGDLVDGKVVPRGQSFVPFSGDQVKVIPQNTVEKTSIRTQNNQTNLSSKIDEVLGNKNYRQPVMLRESTPDVLVELGIRDLPMYENASHIRNNILTESEAKSSGVFRDGDHYHGLGKETFIEAINALDVPRAIFKNNDNNSYMILTAVKDSSGNTVVVPVEIESTTNANRVWIDTNRVKTVYGHNNDFGRTLDQYIKDNIKSNKFTKIEPGARLSDTAGSNMRVSQNSSSVNANNPIYQYYQKFGEDFYERMPDNLKEKYENMLDSQPRDGSGRYTDPITGETWIDAKANQTTSRSYEAESESLPEDFDVKHYVSDQVEAQQKRSKVPLRERISDATAELKHYLVDDAVAYERYIKDKNERLNLREGVDRVRSSDMIARQYMQDHGLGEIGRMSDADLKEFQQYLIAKRAQEVEAQGKKTGRSKAADQALIDSVGDKYAKQEAIIRQYTHDMLEYSAKNGLISEKLKNKLIKENPNYVPMNRVFDVVEKKTGFKSKQLGNLNDQSVVQKMTGSERVVDNPIESLMTNTMRMINEAERNNVAKLISQSEAFHEKVLKDGEKPRAGYDKLSYMIDGETVSYEVPELVAREMKNLNNVLPKAADNILKVVGAPTRWLRSGATQNNPIFAASNLLRDQMQTLVTGNVTANLRGTKDAIVATFSPGKRGQELRAELNRAGIIGSEYRQTYGYKSGDLMAQLQADNNIKKGAVERIKHPMDALGDLIGRTEYFTRAQQYFGTNGDATAKAQAARNNTLNFGRAGATTRILNRIIPFLNAGVQGGRITVNSFKNRPIHTTLAMASITGVALAAKGAAEAQNKELWDRIDDSDKGQNIIIFTPDAHYNSESNRVEGIIKIPVAQMLYPLLDAANNMKGDASDATKLAGDIFTAVTGLEAPNEDKGLLPVVNQLTPTAVKPFLEAAMNKSSYTGSDLVSEYDSNKAPEDKGAKYTTGLARTIAGITGIDAPVVDNFIQNWGGGLAKDLSKVMTDNPDNTKDGGGIGAMFENGFNRRFLSGTVESQYEIAEGLAKNYKNEVRNSDAFKSLSSTEQQKILNAIDSDMNGIASMATKVEQGRNEEIGDKTLTERQTEIVNNGFDADSYINAIIDKDKSYTSNKNGGDVTTLTGNLSDYGKVGGNRGLKVNDSLEQDYKDVLAKYNSMTTDEWNDYLYGESAESAAAEYKLALAKYENDLANDDLTDAQKIKREKALAKLAVSQNWTKNYRDAYSLAGTKADMQAFLNELDDTTKAETVATLNGLNNAMYEAGIITASTYKTRANAINNTTSGKSSGGRKSSSSKSTGMTSAEASALSSLAKTLASADDNVKVKTTSASTTNRKMSRTKSGGNKSGLATYTPSLAKTVSVSSGAKRSIA